MRRDEPTNEEYLQLMREWKSTHSIKEKNRIATIILQGLERLVWMLVKRRAHWMCPTTQDDCFAEANMAIVTKAFKNFNEEKLGRSKVSSYLTYWATQAISRYIDKTDTPVSIPVNARHQARKMLKETGSLSTAMQPYWPRFIYWDKPVLSNEGKPQSLRDIICDREGVAVEPEAIANITKQQRTKLAHDLLNSIDSERDATIVRMRMEGRTLRSIGKAVGLSRQGADNVYWACLKRMRKFAEENSIEGKREAEEKRQRRQRNLDIVTSAKEQLLVEDVGYVPTPNECKTDENGVSILSRKILSRRSRRRTNSDQTQN
jgi:RNA polymerase sigma factor (sigma-70 family)